MQAIETVYKGHRFRSRLEARWAVFFDAMNIKWEYEPEGYDLGEAGCYLPDFFLYYEPREYLYTTTDGLPMPTNSGHWVETKPVRPSEDEKAKMVALSGLTKHSGIILVGAPGNTPFYSTHRNSSVCHEWAASPAMNIIDLVLWPLARFIPDGKENYNDLMRAIELSRGARFEHGETPGGLK